MNVDDYEDHVDERERDEKMNRQQAIIDALVAALEYARGELVDRNGATMSFAKIDAALAMVRKGG